MEKGRRKREKREDYDVLMFHCLVVVKGKRKKMGEYFTWIYHFIHSKWDRK